MIARPPVSATRAIGLAIAAFTMWVLADTAIKLAGESLVPPYEIVAFQGLLIASALFGFRAWKRDIRPLWPVRPDRQLVRACLDLGNVLFVVVALRHLPLDVFYIVVFSAPLLIAILSSVFLQEHLPWRKAAAILAGFAGVVVAVRPFGVHTAGDWTGYAACIACVLCFSTSFVWSRRMTQTERLDSLMFVSACVAAIGGLCGMLWRAAPVTTPLALLLPVIALTVSLGNYFIFRAVRSIPAATVSQYHYTQMLTGAVVAWAIWHETPSFYMLLGAVLIVASGVYMAALETRKEAVLF